MDELNKIDKLYRFLEEQIEFLDDDASWGSMFNLPEQDMYARDYLKFAENQLQIGTIESLINCISNLKRAVDCQIDIFFYTLGLNVVLKKRNLKFEKKLEFLGAIGIFSPKSLAKLNTIRNKMEHEYSIPQIIELDLYFDLVLAFIYNLETAIIVLSTDERNLYNKDGESVNDSYFTLRLDRDSEPPVMKAVWGRRDKDAIVVMFDEYRCFSFYLRCLYLLNIKDAFVSKKYVVEQMKFEYIRLYSELNKK
ncbi:hypothetical protein [Paenibacillus nasutitermitis]|uniref:Uncharacterized protein n=1 Tax=Paenibacillus nasutitermitis TaxID=1652958 RepID=A0A917E327_9BACL|nr:hypothetical protein [Paenibacillus nasutitermitis]GGE00262.1 hypothetical protein GCM10010911_68980 [Paenibacillus nasutitermitis]